jgi:hypothetical protein
MIFRQVQTSRRIIALCLVFLYCWTSSTCPFRGASIPPFISNGEEVIRKITKSVTTLSQSRLSLLAYFTDIAIYSLESMLWSSKILWMMGRVVSNPSLGHPSPCKVVPRVAIVVKYIWHHR